MCTALPSRPARRASAAVLTVLLLLFCAPCCVEAQSRVFTTCEALAEGLESSVISRFSDSVRSFCRSAERFFAGDSDDDAETGTVADEDAEGEGPADEGVAVSTSSAGKVPFSVIGSNESPDTTSAQSGVDTHPNRLRPSGPWFAIVSVDVRSRAATVWSSLRDISTFFEIGLAGLGATTSAEESQSVNVTLNGGGRVVFTEQSRDNDDRYIVFGIDEMSENVYPGFDFAGSRIYVQVLSRGFIFRSTNIELGWGPPESFDIGGDPRVGVVLIESLLLEAITNLEGRFGKRCEFGRNVRTVEGDCNNLNDASRGAARSPQRRLGDGDPAYPRGDRSIPAGPLDVNVREISNALFSTSPGSKILREQATTLRKNCYSLTRDETKYDVCPFRFVTMKTDGRPNVKIPFSRISVSDCEEIVFQFKSKGCSVDVLLKCGGQGYIDLADNPCGAETNRLFHPVGCVIGPGEDTVLSNPDGLTDLFFTFGQFIDHDMVLSPSSKDKTGQPGFSPQGRPSEGLNPKFPIKVPEGDFHFKGHKSFEFLRIEHSEQDPDDHLNIHSSYLDGSQLYGVDFRRSRLLRSFEEGKLGLSKGNYPPFNKLKGPGSLGAVVDNSPNSDSRFFVVGDTRGNEQILLLSMHILFLREHNTVAEQLAKAFPDYDDEILYQTARAIVIAEYQCIIYNEWLPLLLGSNAPDPREFRYDQRLDARVSAIFTAGAFRFGHSMVGTNLLRMGPGPRNKAEMRLIPIRGAFFKPEAITEFGIDPFVRGGAWHRCKEVDNKVVDELRNFLVQDFPLNVTDPPRFDLVALNLQRGRDMGIPSFNAVRELFGLEKYTEFSDLIADPNTADLAKSIYGTVDRVELFFGGLVEEHVLDSQLGETFTEIVAEQFTRLRDGDRFFYSGITFNEDLIERIPIVRKVINHEVRLADVILRNTEIKKSELGERESVFQI